MPSIVVIEESSTGPTIVEVVEAINTDASQLTSGILPDERLSDNVVLTEDLLSEIAGVTINITSPDGSILITNGGSGGVTTSVDLVVGETPSGLVNGSNATYTTAFSFVPESVELFINGLRQNRVTHFTTSGTTTVIISDAPLTGEPIQLNYRKP